jgi:hypothetical protein
MMQRVVARMHNRSRWFCGARRYAAVLLALAIGVHQLVMTMPALHARRRRPSGAGRPVRRSLRVRRLQRVLRRCCGHPATTGLRPDGDPARRPRRHSARAHPRRRGGLVVAAQAETRAPTDIPHLIPSTDGLDMEPEKIVDPTLGPPHVVGPGARPVSDRSPRSSPRSHSAHCPASTTFS